MCPVCGEPETVYEVLSFWGVFCPRLADLEPVDERDELGEAGA